jgi:hypothetical protein
LNANITDADWTAPLGVRVTYSAKLSTALKGDRMMTDVISVSLYELAYRCHLYGAMTGFDAPLKTARNALRPAPDLMKLEHRTAALHFLRAWGCQHLAVADEDIASEALRSWAQCHASNLPEPGRSLETFDKEELAGMAQSFAALAARTAGAHGLFGAVAAAKTLFLVRPHAFPAWDTAIRKNLGCDVSAAGYERYLGIIGRLVKALAEEAGRPVSELPGLVGREESSATELVDECLWVRYAQGCVPPSPRVLDRWATWARGNHPE